MRDPGKHPRFEKAKEIEEERVELDVKKMMKKVPFHVDMGNKF